jgi:membrane fusion protein, multidrug efflux system
LDQQANMKHRLAAAVFALAMIGAILFWVFGLGAYLGKPPAAEAADAPPEVSVVTLQPAPRPIIRELPGRIAPTRIAEVRARVSGIIIERKFEQGGDVAAGDVLYRIDPEPFEVELQAAEAALDKADAAVDQQSRQSQRLQALAASRAASQADLESAIAGARQAAADVKARKADVARAKLNLDRTVIRAPIGGRVGRALVTEGALVQADATHLATVQQLGPVYADFTQSVSELNQLRRAFESGDLERVAPEAIKVRLLVDDEVYEHAGRLLFSDTTVDPTTGQVTLRGEFANPERKLLPGMYVRVRIEQGVDPDALAVPQQAVRRNDSAGSEVFVLRDGNRAAAQPVRLGHAVDGHWLVLDGVKPGDRIVVEGFQKFVNGDAVAPAPWPRDDEAEKSAAGVEPAGTPSRPPARAGHDL